MSRLRLYITRTDIELAIRGDPYACPIALAAIRAGLGGVSVDGVSIAYTHNDIEHCVWLSARAQVLIGQYDHSPVWMAPFAVDVLERNCWVHHDA